MKYKIENKISYNSEDKSLVNIDDDVSMLILSNVSNRLLHFFLCNPGQVLHRNTIFKVVWDDHGLVSSNNNLNHYVSQLRKDLSSLGLDKQTIITIPKVGFKLSEYVAVEHESVIAQAMFGEDTSGIVDSGSADVQFVTDTADITNVKTSVVLHVNEPESDNTVATDNFVASTPRPAFADYKFIFSLKWLTRLILFLLAAASALYVMQKVKENDSEHKKEYLFTIGSCPVFSTNAAMIADFTEQYKSMTKLLIKENNITCKANQFLYTYYAGDFSSQEYDGQAFISLCGQKGEKLSSCKGIYIYSWVKK